MRAGNADPVGGHPSAVKRDSPCMATGHASTRRVLILEPYREVRALLSWLVTHRGAEPVGRDALETGGDPDLVILEPAASPALALVQRLRQRNPALPIVSVSIKPMSREMAELEPLAHVIKPFELDELERTLAAALVDAAESVSNRRLGAQV